MLQKKQDKEKTEEGALKIKMVLGEAHGRGYGWNPIWLRGSAVDGLCLCLISVLLCALA